MEDPTESIRLPLESAFFLHSRVQFISFVSCSRSTKPKPQTPSPLSAQSHLPHRSRRLPLPPHARSRTPISPHDKTAPPLRPQSCSSQFFFSFVRPASSFPTRSSPPYTETLASSLRRSRTSASTPSSSHDEFGLLIRYLPLLSIAAQLPLRARLPSLASSPLRRSFRSTRLPPLHQSSRLPFGTEAFTRSTPSFASKLSPFLLHRSFQLPHLSIEPKTRDSVALPFFLLPSVRSNRSPSFPSRQLCRKMIWTIGTESQLCTLRLSNLIL
ncbi:uncharacterized protein LOC110017928 [Phalaenopsis equestris]|uniref:uncharacterized protein LOC110017928 n=1 Tax=Phalaenopsis equestris TaxID=78828 RepID=UPI0009E30927|nr:uncharacterized protein LOC110017928 [Phalaenopsis equestris]